jgi:hypothetical protein
VQGHPTELSLGAPEVLDVEQLEPGDSAEIARSRERRGDDRVDHRTDRPQVAHLAAPGLGVVAQAGQHRLGGGAVSAVEQLGPEPAHDVVAEQVLGRRVRLYDPTCVITVQRHHQHADDRLVEQVAQHVVRLVDGIDVTAALLAVGGQQETQHGHCDQIDVCRGGAGQPVGGAAERTTAMRGGQRDQRRQGDQLDTGRARVETPTAPDQRDHRQEGQRQVDGHDERDAPEQCQCHHLCRQLARPLPGSARALVSGGRGGLPGRGQQSTGHDDDRGQVGHGPAERQVTGRSRRRRGHSRNGQRRAHRDGTDGSGRDDGHEGRGLAPAAQPLLDQQPADKGLGACSSKPEHD